MINKECKICNKTFLIDKSRIDTAKYCSRICWRIGFKGFKRSDEFKKKVSKGMKRVNTWTAGVKRIDKSGDKSHFWKGGVSQINRTERQNYCSTFEYKQFRRDILKRDNYTCQICGDRTKKGHKILLQIDHIQPFSLFLELRMDKNNVRTVCRPCHYKTDTFGSKVYNYKV